MSLSALTGFFFPAMFSKPIDPIWLARGGGEILYSLVGLLLFAFLLRTQSAKFFRDLQRIVFYGAVLNSFAIIWTTIFHHQNYGMLNNKAADAAFIACMLPVVFKLGLYRKNILVMAIVMVVGIILTGSSTGIAGIGVGMAAVLFQHEGFKKGLLTVVPLAIGISGLGYLFLGDQLLFSSGRDVIFKQAWDFYRTHASPWFGAGTGTYTVWGINHQEGSWVWLHNEYLEVLFENGVLGLLSILLVYSYLLVFLFRKKAVEFPIACVYGFTALTEMPLRLFVTQVLGVCLLSRAFKYEERHG